MPSTFFLPPVYDVTSSSGDGFCQPTTVDGVVGYDVQVPSGSGFVAESGSEVGDTTYTLYHKDIAGQLFVAADGSWIKLGNPHSAAAYDFGYAGLLVSVGALMVIALHVVIRGAAILVEAFNPRQFWE